MSHYSECIEYMKDVQRRFLARAGYSFLLPKRPDWLCGLSNLLFSGYWQLFPRKRSLPVTRLFVAQVNSDLKYTSILSYVVMACTVKDNFFQTY